MRIGRVRWGVLLASLAAMALAGAACSQSAPAQPASAAVVGTTTVATAAPDPFAGVPGIVDPANRGWPREVEGLNGRVTISAKPQRIHTISLGHDETTYALVPAARVVAVGRYTQNPQHSNVAHLAKTVPAVARDAEEIIARSPDIVVASRFARAELMELLKTAGVAVLQTGLHRTPEGHISDILLLGYVYGEEERALELAAEVRGRYEALTAVTRAKPGAARSRVLSLTSYTDKIYTAGLDSTVGGIIEAAGGVNAATEAGIEGVQAVSAEGIVAMQPDVIIITQPGQRAEEFKGQLLTNKALAQVPAIRDGRIYPVGSRIFTTLSFWNIRGAEVLAKILWPDDLSDADQGPFSFPQ